MLAVDTNVLVRFLARDDRNQTARADRIFRENRIWVAKTVLLETEWVLRGSYAFNRQRITADFRGLLSLSTAQSEDEGAVTEALDWYAGGMDFADALHLASSGVATRFASFDRRLAASARRFKAADVLLLS